MKILHVIDSGGLYGAEAVVLTLMLEQQQNGHMPILCSIGVSGIKEKPIVTTAKDINLPVKSFHLHAGLDLLGAFKIINFAKSCHADVIHSHGYKPNILLSLFPKFIRRTPLIATAHGWTNTKKMSKLALYEWFDVKMLKYKDAVVVVNKQMIYNSKFVSANIDKSKLYVVDNGINTTAQLHQPRDCDNRNMIESFTRDTFTIGSIGRLSMEKDYNNLLHSIKILRDAEYDVKLVLIGDGPLYDDLKQQAVRLGLSEYVLFTGYIADAKKYLRFFDVYVISSLTEGMPITLLEAMQNRIPVVSTNVGGIADVLHHDKTGILVPPNDTEKLSAGIEHIIKNPEIAKLFSDRAAVQIEKKYSSQAMASSYQLIYEKVTSANSCHE